MSRGQGQVQFKILCLGHVIHFLSQFFVKNTKNDTKTLFERPKSVKFENRENEEIPGNSVKNGHFRLSKYHKLVIF